jgi:hypothetical protein
MLAQVVKSFFMRGLMCTFSDALAQSELVLRSNIPPLTGRGGSK